MVVNKTGIMYDIPTNATIAERPGILVLEQSHAMGTAIARAGGNIRTVAMAVSHSSLSGFDGFAKDRRPASHS